MVTVDDGTAASMGPFVTPVLHPELVPMQSAFDLIKSKLISRRSLLARLLGLVTAGLVLGFTLYYFAACHYGSGAHWLNLFFMCGVLMFTYNYTLAALFPAEIAQRSMAIVVPQALLAVAVATAGILDFVYHSQRLAKDMRIAHFLLHEALAFGCIAVQAANCYLLAISQLTWSGFRGLQLLDGVVTLLAQVTAVGNFNIGLPGALARSVPPIVAAALMTSENRHWIAARSEINHLHVDLTELPTGALSLSQIAAHEDRAVQEQEDVDSTSASSSDGEDGAPSRARSHGTAKVGGDMPATSTAARRAASRRRASSAADPAAAKVHVAFTTPCQRRPRTISASSAPGL